MHLDLDELIFAMIFIVYNIFMMQLVEGLIAKLFFFGWIVSVLIFGIYVILTREHICSECGKMEKSTFICSICKKPFCYRELAREHPSTCMHCFWKEVGYKE